MLKQIIIGSIGTVLGVVTVWKTHDIVNFTGLSATLERRLGSGGTYTGVRILGTVIALFSFLYLFGFLNQAIESILSFIRGILFTS